MKAIAFLGLLLIACGSVKDDDKIDAGPADSDAADGSSPRCDPDAPFGAPQPLDMLNSTSVEDGGSLSSNELTIYFSSERTGPGAVGALDIYIATRQTRTEAFGAPAVLAGVNTTAHEGRPLATADGRFLYTWTYSTNSYDIILAQRGSIDNDFDTPHFVPSLNETGAADVGDFILPDHSAMYFHTNRVGPGVDIYRAARNVGGTFDVATLVGLPAAYNETAAVVTPDELTIFYASDDPSGEGDLDIYMAKRNSKNDPFGIPQHQDTLSSSDEESPTWVSADGCEIYLNRVVSGRSSDIFLARRGP